MCKGGFLHMQRIKDFGLIKNVFWRKQEIVRNNEKNLVKLTKMYCKIATPIL